MTDHIMLSTNFAASALIAPGLSTARSVPSRSLGSPLWDIAGRAPSLDLNLAQNKNMLDSVTGQSLVTFSRASAGTYVGADGLIKSAAVNEARFDHNPSTGESLGLLVEGARTNLATYSEQLNLWASNTAVTITPNANQAPNGSFTAVRFQETTENNRHQIRATFSSSFSSGGKYVFTIYAKSGALDRVFIYAASSAFSFANATYDLTNLAIAEVHPAASAQISALPNGWRKLQFAITATASGSTIPIHIGRNDTFQVGDPSQDFYLWGAQLEAGSFPTSYIPTPATFTGRTTTATFYDSAGVVQTAASGVARSNAFFPDSNGVMRPAGLLLEAAGTNLVTYSQEFDNAAWTKSAATVSANSTTAPDGTSTADSITEDSANSLHFVNNNFNSSANVYQTFSVFLKANGRNNVVIAGNRTGWNCAFNLSTGQAGTAGAAVSAKGMDRLTNGWYRCWMTIAPDASANVSVRTEIYLADANGNTTYAGNGTSGVFAWGYQVEQSAYPTSYIPTIASTVTRAADTSTSATVTRSVDVAQITGTNFSSWYNQSAGTLIANLRTVNTTQGGVYGSLTAGGADTDQGFYLAASTAQLRGINYLDSGSSSNDIVNNTPLAGLNKIAIAGSIADNTTGAYFNGLTGSVNASRAQGYINVAGMKIGEASGQRLTGTISRLTYWPTRLSDATLQVLTL